VLKHSGERGTEKEVSSEILCADVVEGYESSGRPGEDMEWSARITSSCDLHASCL